MSTFDVEVVLGQQPELRVRGELDLASVERFQEAVSYAIDGGRPDLVVDLREVTFCDSSGLAAMLAARQRVGCLMLRGTSPAVQRTLEATGLDQVFTQQD
jgi:anti-sigma B factor antagonist